MGECKFKCADGKECGIPTSAELCPFHALKIIGKADRRIYENYLANTPRKYFDLSHRIFEDVVFGPNGFPVKMPATFCDSTFRHCTFSGVPFFDYADFRRTVFEQSQFFNLMFDCDKIDFEYSTFLGEHPPFVLVSMNAEESISFWFSKFQSRQDAFVECRIRAKNVNLSHMNVHSDRFLISVRSVANKDFSDVPFSLVVCADRIDMSNLQFNGDFTYTQIDVGASPEVILTNVNFAGMRSATFQDANLSKTHFDSAAIGGVRFLNTSWDERGNRSILYEDTQPISDPRKLRRIISTYIQFKKNFEEARNFIDAGNWFYREMECRRRLLGARSNCVWRWLRQHVFALTPWYKYVSEYGENYFRPAVWILLVLIGFATAHFYSGFSLGADSACTVNYKPGSEYSEGAASDFITALAFSGGIMLLQFVKLAAEQPSPTPVLAVIQVILTLILVPFFLLALRRKFRR